MGLTMKDRYEDNLIGFARDELSAEEQAWMDEYLSSHPEDREHAMFMTSTFNAYGQMATNIQGDSNDGLDELLARIDREVPNSTKRRALMDRIWERLQSVADRIPTGMSPTISVHFTPTASESEIRSLLQKMNGRIVNGPDAEAFYSIKVKGSRPQHLVSKFLENPIVDTARLRSKRKKTS